VDFPSKGKLFSLEEKKVAKILLKNQITEEEFRRNFREITKNENVYFCIDCMVFDFD